MKKSYLVITILLFIVLHGFSQVLSLSGGIKMVKSTNKSVYFWYVDESPSRDNISAEILQKGRLALFVTGRAESEDNYSGFNLFGELQGYVGSMNGLSASLGAVYKNNYDKKINFRPELGCVLGYCSKPIGIIENNDIYIQVNQTKFQDYTNVRTSLRSVYFGIKPGLNIMIGGGDNYQIGVGVSYQLAVKFGYINFSGVDDNGNSVSDTENLTESNVGFYVDGEQTNQVPFNSNGPEFKLTLLFK